MSVVLSLMPYLSLAGVIASVILLFLFVLEAFYFSMGAPSPRWLGAIGGMIVLCWLFCIIGLVFLGVLYGMGF